MDTPEERRPLSIDEWRQRTDEQREQRRQEMDEKRNKAREEFQAAVEAQQQDEFEFMDAGYEETLPGQTEIVAGSVAHTQVLNSYHNATSYGPDVNVVVAPEPEEMETEQEPEPQAEHVSEHPYEEEQQ